MYFNLPFKPPFGLSQGQFFMILSAMSLIVTAIFVWLANLIGTVIAFGVTIFLLYTAKAHMSREE
jgi:hypothetical protein